MTAASPSPGKRQEQGEAISAVVPAGLRPRHLRPAAIRPSARSARPPRQGDGLAVRRRAAYPPAPTRGTGPGRR